jgi:hypothetical protein
LGKNFEGSHFRDFSPKALSFEGPRRKEVSSFERVLIYTVNDISGDITEGKEVSEWIWIGSLVSEFLELMEYVL